MCTLSWLPDSGGFRVFFNRDERLTRAPAIAPRIHEIGGVRFLAPVDGDFGGTWIGVNEHGVAMALLNRYQDRPRQGRSGQISRGLLVRDLLGLVDQQAIEHHLGALTRHSYSPFTIGVVEDRRGVAIGDWDGRRLVWTRHAAAGLVRTSSGHDQETAERTRTAAFETLAGGSVSAPLLRRFHRSHLPGRGAASTCMHRSDAATQSYTEVRVTRTAATVRYHPGPPCERHPMEVHRLTLRPGSR